MVMKYNAPHTNPSTMGEQEFVRWYKRRALVDAMQNEFFGQFSTREVMPKHYGKKISQDVIHPIISDQNLTSEGIDANGLTTNRKVTITIVAAGNTATYAIHNRLRSETQATHYAVGEGPDAATALANAKADAVNIFKQLGVFNTDYDTTVAEVTDNTKFNPVWVVSVSPDVPATGNLWASSRSVGNVTQKIPYIGETGGRVNRVGTTRHKIESTLRNVGIFREWTADSVDFDTDRELQAHWEREMLRAGMEIKETLLQLDILNSAGLVRYCGDAVSTATMTGETGDVKSAVTYEDLMRLDMDQNAVRTPKKISAIYGTRRVDTRTVQNARVLLVGSELVPMLRKMKDSFGDRAFIGVEKYGGNTTGLKGEIGAVGPYRIVEVPSMLYWDGAGKAVGSNGGNAGYRETNGKYNIYPMISVAPGAFAEIGFYGANGGSVGSKWLRMTKKPGMETMDRNDPYGKQGIESLQWWYGYLAMRPEWIAMIKTVAEL